MLQSLDGIISRGKEDDLSWGSKEDKDFFRSKVNEIRTMIMGSNTYESMPKSAFKNKYSLVLTSNPLKYSEEEQENVKFFSGTPFEAVDFLKRAGKENIALIGGGTVNGQFLKSGLIDELYVTIAPRIFGKGIRIFGDMELDANMELVEFEKLTDNEILLHYRVIRK